MMRMLTWMVMMMTMRDNVSRIVRCQFLKRAKLFVEVLQSLISFLLHNPLRLVSFDFEASC